MSLIVPNRRHARLAMSRAGLVGLPLLAASALLAVPRAASAGDIHPNAYSASPTLSVHWRVRLNKLPIMAWKPHATAEPRLTRDGLGVIFAGTHGVAVLRVSDGAELWRFATADAVEGHVAERDGVIYAAAADGQVFALDRGTGRSLWSSTKLRAAVHAGVAVDARFLYVVADPGTVHAISRKTGKVVWRRSASTSREFLVEGHGSAMLHRNLVLAGTAAGRLLALSTRDGAIAWQALLGDRATTYTDVDSTPVRLGPSLVVASAHNGGVFALSLSDGAIVWRKKLSGARQPWVHGSSVYLIAGDGDLHALEADGRRRWARNVQTQPSGAMAFAGDLILIPTAGGLVLARQKDGVSVARFDDGYGFSGAPLVVGNRIFTLSNAGVAYSLLLSR